MGQHMTYGTVRGPFFHSVPMGRTITDHHALSDGWEQTVQAIQQMADDGAAVTVTLHHSGWCRALVRARGRRGATLPDREYEFKVDYTGRILHPSGHTAAGIHLARRD